MDSSVIFYSALIWLILLSLYLYRILHLSSYQ
nr:MAG TPA: hypothetical protein [Caudoviricetes sp.]